jgi:hypothetical protein
MLADELPPKQNSTVFSRINAALHDEIAQQMREWEKKNEVKVYPMGATSDNRDCPQQATWFDYPEKGKESIKRGAQNGANALKLAAKLKRDKRK